MQNDHEDGTFIIRNSNYVMDMVQPFWLHQEIKNLIYQILQHKLQTTWWLFCMATDSISKLAAGELETTQIN